MSRSSGKALDLNTKIYGALETKAPTDERFKSLTLKDLKVGDFIYGDDGKLTQVIHLNSIIFESPYEIEFENGDIIKSNSQHLWKIYDSRYPEKGYNFRNTEFIYDNYNKSSIHKLDVPMNNPIEYPFPRSSLPIEPYLFGYWLGDGSKDNCELTVCKEDKESLISNIKNSCTTFYESPKKDNNGNISTNFSIFVDRKKELLNIYSDITRKDNRTFLEKIKKLGVFNNKFVPNRYMYASIEQRLSLLQGLCDSDGTVDGKGRCEFTNSNKKLCYQVSELLFSLGIKNKVYHRFQTVKKKDGSIGEIWRVQFYTTKDFSVFRLKRKKEKLRDTLPEGWNRNKIVSIKKLDAPIPMRCITVNNESGCFLCGEHCTVTHNSYLSSPLMMTRAILIPNTNTYIMGPAGGQAQETFGKMESLAKNQIASVLGVTSVFLEETVRQNNTADPFVHDKNSYHVELYNGSTINTLNSVAKNIVGIRSNFSVFEEAGKIDRTYYALTEPFSVQDTNFITGGNLNIDCYPEQLQNKKLFMSSAEGIDSELFDQYKRCFEKMLQGDSNYFVCDIDCEQSISPRKDGKLFRPLVTKEEVENAMATNPYKATREYYNKFDRDGGTDNLVKRSTLEKLSQAYLPSFKNEDNKKKYVITYDPASRLDNSVILVGEFFKDEERGWMAKIVNCINLIEILENGEKVVIQKPEQIIRLKDLILAYNGSVGDYDNLLRIIIDGGSGGGGFEIAQEILPDWKGKDGKMHRGFIDLEDPHMKLRADDYIGDCKDIEIFNFTRDKVRAYENAQNMINQGLMIFPKSPNIRGELEYEVTDSDGNINLRYDKLNNREFNAWNQVDLLKEELIAMQKTKNKNNTIQFEISHEKKIQGMHDDHSDTCAMMCDYLARLRANDVLDVQKEKHSYDVLFSSMSNKSGNPFNEAENPFAGLSTSNPFTK